MDELKETISKILGSEDFVNTKGFDYSMKILRLESLTGLTEQKKIAKYVGISLSDFIDYEQGLSINYAGYESIINKLELLKNKIKEVNNYGLYQV